MAFAKEQLITVFNILAENEISLMIEKNSGNITTSSGLTYEELFKDIPKDTFIEIIDYLNDHEWMSKMDLSEVSICSIDETEALADNNLSIDFGDPSSLRALTRNTVASQVPIPFSKMNKSIIDVADKKFKTGTFTKELAEEWFETIGVHFNIIQNVIGLINNDLQEEINNGLITSLPGLTNNVKAEYYRLAELISTFWGRVEKVVKGKFAERMESPEVLEYVRKELISLAGDFELEIELPSGDNLYFKIPKIRQYKRTFGRLGKSKKKSK